MKKYIFIIVSFLLSISYLESSAQNKYEEVISYEEIDGMVVFPLSIKGKEYKFIFDPMALPAILDEYTDEIGFLRNEIDIIYYRSEIEVLTGGSIEKISIGKTIFTEKIGALSVRSEYLKSKGITGVVNALPFLGSVATINSQNKTITLSTPYKPKYISLRNKADLENKLRTFDIKIGQKDLTVYLDLAGGKQLLTLSEKDFEELKKSSNILTSEINITRLSSFKPTQEKVQQATIPSMSIANNTFNGENAYVLSNDSISRIGAGILDKGILSLDYVKGRLYFQKFEDIDQSEIPQIAQVAKENTKNNDFIMDLTRLDFGDYVFDYKTESEWNYKGDIPCIIDFWAEWCGPCKRITKTIEELESQYKGKIRVFKVNIDNEPEIAKYFDAKALPLLLYVPMDGEPVRMTGAMPKNSIESNIEKILLKK